MFDRVLNTPLNIGLTFFFPIFPIDPPENIGKAKIFWWFLGDQKGTLGRKGLKWVRELLRILGDQLSREEGLYHIETSLLICRFYMKRTSFMKKLRQLIQDYPEHSTNVAKGRKLIIAIISDEGPNEQFAEIERFFLSLVAWTDFFKR